MTIIQNLINSLNTFFDWAFDMYYDFSQAVTSDESGVLLTFVVAFPICFLGIWIIKKLIRVKD